ncbi:MAG: hypothetical protein Fur0041_21490 [Bacteroidia bacterium]
MRIYIFLAFVSLFHFSYAQQSNIWKFGDGAGMDFSSGNPVALPQGPMNTLEGISSACDNAGNLLFYTNGNEVRDRNDNLMPNGSNLSGGSSATMCMVIPWPGNCGKYFIFHVEDHTGTGKLYYSAVDMCLNNGNGDVMPSIKNIQINATSAEKICATPHANGNDIWVITHDLGNDQFRVFPVTSAGVGTSVVTAIGSSYAANCMIGNMKISHNGQKLVTENTFCNLVELLDFNNSTGQLSNVMNLTLTLGLTGGYYGAEFSPNNQLLYLSSTWIVNYLYQVDLTTMNTTQLAMQNGNYIFGGMQLGPDGKIYIARNLTGFLDVIASPNTTGAGCNYQSQGFSLGSAFSNMGMPNIYEGFIQPVNPSGFSITLGNDTTLPCAFSPFQISPGSFCNATYIWQDNSTGSSFTVSSPGIFWVEVQSACGISRDTLVVSSVSAMPQFSYEQQKCSGVLFNSDAVPGFQYIWDFGDNHSDSSATVLHEFILPGTYNVCLYITDGQGCDDTLCQTVDVSNNQPDPVVPNVFTPNGDGINDSLIIANMEECTPFIFEVYDRWGVQLFRTEHPANVFWDGKAPNGKKVTEGVYFWILTSAGYEKKGIVTVFK